MFARAPLGLCLLALSLAACGARTVRQDVYSSGGIDVVLRSQTKGGEPIARGFDHPSTISGVRLAHILSSIDVRTGDDGANREPAVPLQMLYKVADALALGLSKAGPNQEVVVMVTQRKRRLKIFTDDHLTSFVAFVKGDQLQLHFSRFDWAIPKGPNERIPEPRVGEEVMKFHVFPSDAMVALGSQAVGVDWRDSAFRQPLRLNVTPGGQLMRRSILMESEEPASEPKTSRGAGDDVGGLSPDTLRDLADLEEARRNGELSEMEYQSQRRQILREAQSQAP